MTTEQRKLVDSKLYTRHPDKSIVAFTSTGPTIRIGEFVLRELADGSLWLENKDGEAMQTHPKKLEKCLAKFMAEHF